MLLFASSLHPLDPNKFNIKSFKDSDWIQANFEVWLDLKSWCQAAGKLSAVINLKSTLSATAKISKSFGLPSLIAWVTSIKPTKQDKESEWQWLMNRPARQWSYTGLIKSWIIEKKVKARFQDYSSILWQFVELREEIVSSSRGNSCQRDIFPSSTPITLDIFLLLLNGLSSLTQIENIFSRVGCVVIRNFALPDWPRKFGWVPTGKESTRLVGLCLIYNWVAEIVNADWLAHAQRLSYVNAKFGENSP